MNFGCSFSIIVFLLVSLHSFSTFAVLCPTGKWDTDEIGDIKPTIVTFNNNEVKECSTCVIYYCYKTEKLPAAQKGGCPEDYYKDCKAYGKAIDLVKNSDSNILELNSHKETGYISGCSGYCNGTECIKKKYLQWAKDVKNLPKVNGIPSRFEKDPEGLKDDICDKSVLTTTLNLIPNSTINQNRNGSGDSSASKGQDGTMKNIGIFLIGFIFSAWIY